MQKNNSEEKINYFKSEFFKSAADPRFKIVYLFPHATQKLSEASTFGWYSKGILETALPMQAACKLPTDIREAYSDTAAVLMHRLTGATWPHLQPIELDSFNAALRLISSPFIVCVTTNAEVAATIDEILRTQEFPILHVSSISGPGRIHPKRFTLETIYEFVRTVVKALSQKTSTKNFSILCSQILSSRSQRKLKKHPMRLGKHNVTAPNEIALTAFGYKFPSIQIISNPIEMPELLSVDKYVKRICESADAVNFVRKNILKDHSLGFEDNRLILAVASSDAALYRSWKDILQKSPEKIRRGVKRALKLVIHSSTYYYEIPINDEGRPDITEIELFVAKQLSKDLRAFTSALAVLSSATLCPVLRLEPRLNSVRVAAAELARCVRAAGIRHAYKQTRLLRLLGEEMRSLIHVDFLNRIDANEIKFIEGIKLVTDLPLELLPSNGIPLGLRFDVSRLSPVPGNIFWRASNMLPIHIPQEKFYDVLIVRSFTNTDPIRSMLENALKIVEKINKFSRLKYRIVDVSTSDEFVTAINKFKSPIMIFDGHGKFDPETGIGRLVVGGKSLDTWLLKKNCHLPPLVIFSACDTQPIDGTHGSVATSAFALGAYAVLGTILPVNASHAAILIARMLYRIDQFLPVAVNAFSKVTWRNIISAILRMSHISEASRLLKIRARINISDTSLFQIEKETNLAINTLNPNWHNIWIQSISKQTGHTDEEIRIMLQRHVGLTDAMKYVQLGNPERVFIY